MAGKSPADLWEELGSLDEFEAMQVLTSLFSQYEAVYESSPESREASSFFRELETAISVISECNLKRR